MSAKSTKWLWYAGTGGFLVIALWTLNYILFLAMESARTYANLPVIKERYHWMLAVLAISLLGAVLCFLKARRSQLQSPDLGSK